MAPISSKPEPPVELLRPVGRVGDHEHLLAALRRGRVGGGGDRRARVPAPAARLDRAHLVDLAEAVVDVEAARARGVVGRRGEVARARARGRSGRPSRRAGGPPRPASRTAARAGTRRARRRPASRLTSPPAPGSGGAVGRPAAQHDQDAEDVPARLARTRGASRAPSCSSWTTSLRWPKAAWTSSASRVELARARRRGPPRGSRSPARRAAGWA